jgi:uncharacterized protein (DUF1800 family)
MAIGVDGYIDEQLHPQSLALPATLSQKLGRLDTVTLSQRELLNEFREASKASREQKKNEKGDDKRGENELRTLVQRIAAEAGEARLLPAIESPRQLEEVMVDFWFNHFNIFINKEADRVLIGNYEREAIRPYVFGRFRDLLGATAHHPAMLFYLDNWMSASADYRPPRAAGPLGKVSGLNENYARELMELHTLGVDGGYTQSDVTELARMLTGWTIRPRGGFGGSMFGFDGDMHDRGDKIWLGKTIRNDGQNEGEYALDLLARHPATAHFISYQLAQYFVADRPPTTLVERLARRYLESDGDIRAILATLFASPEFRDPGKVGVKFKTPYQYVLSVARAGALPVQNVRPLLATLYQLGMPLYGSITPDGYKNTEAAWLNADALTRRINFATAYASGKFPLNQEVSDGPAGMGEKRAQRMAERMDGGRMRSDGNVSPVDADALLATLGSSITRSTRQIVSENPPALRAALILGSPDFMRH